VRTPPPPPPRRPARAGGGGGGGGVEPGCPWGLYDLAPHTGKTHHIKLSP